MQISLAWRKGIHPACDANNVGCFGCHQNTSLISLSVTHPHSSRRCNILLTCLLNQSEDLPYRVRYVEGGVSPYPASLPARHHHHRPSSSPEIGHPLTRTVRSLAWLRLSLRPPVTLWTPTRLVEGTPRHQGHATPRQPTAPTAAASPPWSKPLRQERKRTVLVALVVGTVCLQLNCTFVPGIKQLQPAAACSTKSDQQGLLPWGPGDAVCNLHQ